jgi:hypothetical protein
MLMPLTPPLIPFTERDVRDRIKAKFSEYNSVVRNNPNPDPGLSAQLKGERYEIVVAIYLYKKGKFTNGNQISRWAIDGILRNQEIKIGFNTEYDFFLPGAAASFPLLVANVPNANGFGNILGETKHGNGIGAYMKKAAGYCLHDPSLGGFCFATPTMEFSTFQSMIENTYTVLSKPGLTPALCGGPSWTNRPAALGKPSGVQIQQHFQQYATHANRQALKKASVRSIVSELATHAGFIIACFQVPAKNHNELAVMVRDL